MRDLFIEKLYEWSKKPYSKYFKKNKPWPITVGALLQMEEQSLGFHLGCFLLQHNFEMQPKLEDHDVTHVLTGTRVMVADEIGMQYLLFGNGKLSLYLLLVIITGTLCYPEKIECFVQQYFRGKKAHRFYDIHFEQLLHMPLTTLQETFNIIPNETVFAITSKK